MSRNYLDNPYSIFDLAEAAHYTIVDYDGFDFSWYTSSRYYSGPVIDKLIISWHDYDRDDLSGTTPDNYRIVGFIDADGNQHLVTYADGHGFEYTDTVAWGRVLNVYSILTTKADFLNILQYIDVSHPGANDFQNK